VNNISGYSRVRGEWKKETAFFIPFISAGKQIGALSWVLAVGDNILSRTVHKEK